MLGSDLFSKFRDSKFWLLSLIKERPIIDGEIMTRAFDHIQYCPLVLRRFQTVEIDIRDDTGVKIPFERGQPMD
jgi:DUF917 family protein